MPWYAKDCHYLDDPKIMRLGDRFGAAGPLVIDRLMAKAKLLGKRGRIEYVFRSLAADTFAESAEQAREIVLAAVELRVLAELDEDGFAFSATFPPATWERWQRNFRQQQHRDRKRHEQAEVTADNAPSRGITDRTGQDRTGQDRKSARAKKAKRIEADRLPDGFPKHLEPVAANVLAILVRIAEAKGAILPELAAVGRAIQSYPDRDYAERAGDLEHWLIHGTGQRNKVRDVVGYYRNQLDRAPKVASVTPIQSRGTGQPDRSEYDAKVKVIGA